MIPQRHLEQHGQIAYNSKQLPQVKTMKQQTKEKVLLFLVKIENIALKALP